MSEISEPIKRYQLLTGSNPDHEGDLNAQGCRIYYNIPPPSGHGSNATARTRSRSTFHERRDALRDLLRVWGGAVTELAHCDGRQSHSSKGNGSFTPFAAPFIMTSTSRVDVYSATGMGRAVAGSSTDSLI